MNLLSLNEVIEAKNKFDKAKEFRNWNDLFLKNCKKIVWIDRCNIDKFGLKVKCILVSVSESFFESIHNKIKLS